MQIKINFKKLVSYLLVVIITMASTYATTKFSDIKASAWYYSHVVSLYNKGIIGGYQSGEFKPNQYVTRAEISKMLDLAMKELEPYNDNILNNCLRSVVVIMDENNYILGTGVAILDGSKILTANHVTSIIQDKTNIKIGVYNSRVTSSENINYTPTYNGSVVFSDVSKDISVIELSNGRLVPINFSLDYKVGDPVFTIGHPFGYSYTVSYGRVSKLQTTFGHNTSNKYDQLDMSVNPGNSGGAVFNSHGEIIGIVLSKVDETKGSGIAFIRSASDIVSFLYDNGHRVE